MSVDINGFDFTDVVASSKPENKILLKSGFTRKTTQNKSADR